MVLIDLKEILIKWRWVFIFLVFILIISFTGSVFLRDANLSTGAGISHKHNWIMTSGYIIIPILIAGMLWGIISLLKKHKEANEEFMSLMISLSSLTELKDRYTEGHCRRARNWVSAIGKKMQLDSNEIDDITAAATIHDIGKIGIPDSILNKPDKLNDVEFAKIKEHPLLGLDSIRYIKRLRNLIGIIKHHHESYNGSGYPNKLKGENIPLGARVIAVVDTFDAMTSDRAYRKALPMEKAVSILIDEKGKQFDPHIVDIFIELLKKGEIKEELDPVCGMEITNSHLNFHKLYHEKMYFFCSETCMEEFERNPSKYVKEKN